MSKRTIEAVYPLSPMQQGMLFHSLYAPESGVYCEQMMCTLRGDLNVPAFERAWQRVVDRQAVLRTAFAWKQVDRTLQVVYRNVELPITHHDWRGLTEVEQQTRLDAYLHADRSRGFDVSQAPLMRLALIRLTDHTYRLVWSHHHLLLDGWSMPLLFKEVFTFYEAFRAGQDLWPDTPRPYRDYIAWIGRQDVSKTEAFWRQALKGFTAPTPLVVDHSAEGEERFAEMEIRLFPAVTGALQSLLRQQHVTLNTLVQGAWALLLSRYSGEEDVVFGATVSGRPPELPGIETMIGLFINTLPLRARVSAEMPVVTWLKELQAQQVELRQYEYSSLAQIQVWSDVPRGMPLFENLLVFENYPVDSTLREQAASLDIEGVRVIEQTNYPLTVVSGPGEALPLKIAYDCRRFDDETIRRMLGHLRTLLENIAADPQQPLSKVALLTETERRQLLVEWNDTAAGFPADRCIHQLFEAQVERTPEATAVVFEDEMLTYRELNRRANQLAHYLQKSGVGPEVIVGICVERSIKMIVGVLGVLKAGGAYLPLDPTYPNERLAFMLEDTQAPVLLTQTRLVDQMPAHEAKVICLDGNWPAIAQERDENPVCQAAADNLAYIIYTSGSTGRPKGVLLQHRGLCNFTAEQSRDFGMTAGSRVLQFASFSFDASVAEIFTTLTHGATLHLARTETLVLPADLLQLLRDQAITEATLPPSLIELLPGADLPDLRTLASAGESCPVEVAKRWATGRRFLNAYGPTESTVGACWYHVEVPEQLNASVPIGRPIANAQIYLLDQQLQPVPIGVPGELHIGGIGLARGYLNRPDLTAERFIENPFGKDEDGLSALLYKTGDLARYRADGIIEFLGRVDHQVKVRGFRIELNEIEAVLGQHPGVREAAAAVWGEGPNRRIVAYVAPADPAHKTENQTASLIGEVHLRLQERLPAYMVPSSIVILEALPRLPNGKIDRRVLPAPDQTRPELGTPFVAPRLPQEEILAGIWSHILGVERVGIHDNFFELGGHSLLATQLISRLREAFGVELPLRALFETPTVAGLAQSVEAARGKAGAQLPPIQRIPHEGQAPLSFAQQRLWFLDQLAPGNLAYRIPSAVRLRGSLDITAIESSLNEIVRRHETLRTTFATVKGQPVQVITPELHLPLPVVDLRDLPETEREPEALRLAEEEARQPFDLARGPLLRARLLRLADDDHIALLTMHHIVSDGWSSGVLTRELAALYESFVAGTPSLLPDLPVQYADFARWQRDWLQGKADDPRAPRLQLATPDPTGRPPTVMVEGGWQVASQPAEAGGESSPLVGGGMPSPLQIQLAYWKEQLGGTLPILDLPADHPRPAVRTSRGAHRIFALPRRLSDALQALSRREGVTLFMTLTAAFQTLLSRYTGQEDICVGTPIANRTRAELEGLIGFFANTLVIRTDVSGDPTFRELLKRVRSVALGAYAHQDLPFEQLVEALQPQRDLSHMPLFQVMFVLDNTPQQVIVNLPGLSLTPLEVETGIATFDLTLAMHDGPSELSGYVEYNANLFDAATIERLVGHWQTLLEAIAAGPEQHLSTLPLLTGAERRQMLIEWNNTAVDFPRNRCIHELFEEQVEQRPDATALMFEDTSMTYRELNERANQLAHYLRKQSAGPDRLIGIATERSIEMIVGILGILKAGSAYLPLDPTYPPERLAFMLQDSQVPILLTQAHLVERLPAHDAQVICLDVDWPIVAQESKDNPHSGATAENLAYVIYTSGSTGRPKGTMLQHRGLCNLTDVQQRTFGIVEGSRVLQFSPFSFDASVWETFMALRNGGTLCLARQETLASAPDLARLMRDQAITTVTLPPSVLAVLSPVDLPGLHTVIAAGEACPAELVKRWSPGRRFFNAYGPTETTVCASMYLCDENDPHDPPIGKPIANAQLYILDRNTQPAPLGVPGELHIGGVSLARGYLDRPEMTAEKFMLNPFSDEPGARLYKTGDLVRYRADGNIEFLGRVDQQVKVRGFRIELGEIESMLRQHPAVREGVVLAREDVSGDKRLVAYVVPNNGRQTKTDETPGQASSTVAQPASLVGEMKGFLKQHLPEYMLPSIFVVLDALPLSPSGKVDRRALPAPDSARPDLERAYAAPRTPTEETLAAICAELLAIDQVGIYDNFFDLGGHSLLATQFISRLRDSFHVELALRSLFETPTVAELARKIDEALPSQPKDMDKIAEMLKRLDQLSEADVRTMLEATGHRQAE